MASRSLRDAGVSDASREKALKNAYKFFDAQGAFCP
ncbi:MAG: hypothetical protein EOP88_03830 [Verrucomicrobiaceae bacterium]|nr:MAG: hypothetical protein EOP88_03830 [Verrucomicrobiaceae bacterium]